VSLYVLHVCISILLYVCIKPYQNYLEGERISVRITLFGLVVENSVRRMLFFTISG
jgi:hypothetical protein